MKRLRQAWPVSKWLGGRNLAASLALVGILAALAYAPPAGAQRRKRKKAPPKPLAIAQADILDSENGYPIPLDSFFYPGETVHLRFLVDGYSRGEYDRIWLTWRIDSFGPAGDRFVMAETGGVDTELAPQDNKWRPIIRHSPTIPPHAEAGDYNVTVQVTDQLKKATVKHKIAIRVRGESVTPGKELTVRRFVLMKTAGGAPYDDALFEPGDTIFGEFFITGYRLTDENSFDVHAGLQFLDQEGEVLFDFRPQDQQGASFYPTALAPRDIPPRSGRHTRPGRLPDRPQDRRPPRQAGLRDAQTLPRGVTVDGPAIFYRSRCCRAACSSTECSPSFPTKSARRQRHSLFEPPLLPSERTTWRNSAVRCT